MIGHIYGRVQLLLGQDRPNMFVNELRLYAEYLRTELEKRLDQSGIRDRLDLTVFRANLLKGIEYYRMMIPRLVEETEQYREKMREELLEVEQQLLAGEINIVLL